MTRILTALQAIELRQLKDPQKAAEVLNQESTPQGPQEPVSAEVEEEAPQKEPPFDPPEPQPENYSPELELQQRETDSSYPLERLEEISRTVVFLHEEEDTVRETFSGVSLSREESPASGTSSEAIASEESPSADDDYFASLFGMVKEERNHPPEVSLQQVEEIAKIPSPVEEVATEAKAEPEIESNNSAAVQPKDETAEEASIVVDHAELPPSDSLNLPEISSLVEEPQSAAVFESIVSQGTSKLEVPLEELDSDQHSATMFAEEASVAEISDSSHVGPVDAEPELDSGQQQADSAESPASFEPDADPVTLALSSPADVADESAEESEENAAEEDESEAFHTVSFPGKAPTGGAFKHRSTSEIENLVSHALADEATAAQFRATSSAIVKQFTSKKSAVLLARMQHENEGNETMLFALAATLASQQKMRVLLVDGDLTTRYLTEMFDETGNPGLVEVLGLHRNWRDLIVETSLSNVCFLPAGRGAALVSEKASRDMAALLADLSELFDLVLIDGGVASSDWIRPWGRASEGLFLTLSLGGDTREELHTTVNNLRSGGARVLGGIVVA